MQKKQIVASFAYGNPFPLLIDCLLVLVYGQLGLSCSVSFPFWSSHQDMQCIDSRGDCLDCLEIFFER
jgi:hypothetical protein